jgi:hypothetical protein
MYSITPYSYRQAKKLGITIYPSENPKYKIDIYDGKGLFMFSIGARGMMDYPTYKLKYGKEYAQERRRLYRIRHHKELDNKGTRGWYASKILW